MSGKSLESIFTSEGNTFLKYGISFLGASCVYFLILYFGQREFIGVMTYIIIVGMLTEGFVRMQNGGTIKTALFISAKYHGIGLVYFLLRSFLATKYGINIPI